MTECKEYVCVWVHSVRVPKHAFCLVVSKCVHVRVWACWPVTPRVSTPAMCACKHAFVCVCIMQNSLACYPNLKKKSHTARRPLWNTRCSFGKSRQLGCLHFSDWEGKKSRCPLSCSAASIQRSLTSPWVTDLCVWGGLVIKRVLEKVTKHHMMTCSRRHDTMQQCWK